MQKAIVLLSVVALVAPVFASQSVSALATTNATVNASGVRTQDYYVNIEGASNGSYACYGVTRFDTAGLKAQLDAAFPGGWAVESIALDLVQSNSSFTLDGLVNVSYTNMDAANLTAGSTDLVYGDYAADFSDAQLVTSYTFTETASGDLESHTLYQSVDGTTPLLTDFLSDSVLTLTLYEGDATVAATYAGVTSYSYAGPTLVVTAGAVPEPASLLLIGLAGLIVRRR